MSVELKMMETIMRSEDDLQKRWLLGEESFNRMLAEVKAVATDRDEQELLLTERVVFELMQPGSKKTQQSNISMKKKREDVPDKTQVVKKRKVCTSDYNYIEEKAAAARNYVAKIRSQSCGIRSRNRRGEDDEYYVSKKRKASSTETIIMCHNEEKAASASASGRNYHKKIRKISFGSSSRSSRKVDDQDQDNNYYDEDEACELIKKKKEKEKKKAKKVSVEPALSIPYPPPEMPEEFKNKIQSLHGYQVQLVMQKKLTATDLSLHHDRLAMPANQVTNKDFLGQKFKKKLEDDKFLRVTVIDPRLKVYDGLGLTKWNCTGSFAYVINKGWNKISTDERDRLKVNDVIQVWSFRVEIELENPVKQERLCFALVRIKGGKEDVDGGSNGCQEAIESSMTKKDEEKEDVNGSNGSYQSIKSSSSMNRIDEGKKDTDDPSDRQEVLESSSMSKKDEGEKRLVVVPPLPATKQLNHP